MRWFFFLLLLSNLSLAGWIYWQFEVTPTLPDEPIASLKQDGRLRLLSEMSPQERLPIRLDDMSTTETPAVPVAAISDTLPSETIIEERPAVVALACLRITTSTKAPDFEEIAKKAGKLDLKRLSSGEEPVTRQSYWVYIPPYKTANAVRAASAQLAKAKVRDFLVVRSGEYKHGISLGLFSQQERAERRLQEILALKLSIRRPEIQPRSTTSRGYWMVVQLVSGEAPSVLQTRLEAEGYQVMPVDCPV